MIAAVGENLELGAGNALLWHLPDDFSWFIKHTKGKALIMGRKTMESLGKPLKNRTNIVLTSQSEVLPGFEIASNWEQAQLIWPTAAAKQSKKASSFRKMCTSSGTIFGIFFGEHKMGCF